KADHPASTAAARARQKSGRWLTGDLPPQVGLLVACLQPVPDRPAFGVGDARPHHPSSPLLRPLDLAGMKRPICAIQDEGFGVSQHITVPTEDEVGVRHQLITVPTQLAGNPIACAAGQRGTEASVEGGGMAPLFGLWQLVEPFAQTRSLRIRFGARAGARLWLRLSFLCRFASCG